MKRNYHTLTLLTGIFLVSGVFFMRLYSGPSSASADAAVPPQQESSTNMSVADTIKSAVSAWGDDDGPAPTKVAKATKTGNSAPSTTGKTSNPGSSNSVSGSSIHNSSGYTNGTYTGSASYYTPGNPQAISISLTVANGVVTDASVSNTEYDGTSARFQEAFASSYRSYVVGKSLASLSLNRVAGASLTTAAFDSALSQVRSKATA